MTPDLIALVLSLPIPVRLALLDADPTGAGWYMNLGEVGVFLCQADYGTDRLRHYVKEFGDVWLPCNPRAIERHAQRLYRDRLLSLPSCEVVIRSDGAVSSRLPEGAAELQYRYHRALQIAVTPDPDSTSERDYMNAIALLREVVGG